MQTCCAACKYTQMQPPFLRAGGRTRGVMQTVGVQVGVCRRVIPVKGAVQGGSGAGMAGVGWSI